MKEIYVKYVGLDLVFGIRKKKAFSNCDKYEVMFCGLDDSRVTFMFSNNKFHKSTELQNCL